MSWSDKLKDLIKVHLPQLKSLVNFNININCNNSNETVEYSQKLNRVDVNIEKLSVKERAVFAEVLHEAKEDDKILLENKSAELVEDFNEKDRSQGAQDTISFLKEVAPAEDIVIWRAALYIRQKFEERKDIVELKSDLVAKYGEKGRNISNLCSARYIEDLLKPNYEFIIENVAEDVRKEHVKRLYGLVVNELAITIFVHFGMKEDVIKREIEAKIDQNLKYGIKFLNIHGIGKRNVQKIKETIDGVQKVFKKKGKEIENIIYNQEKDIIFARIEF